MKTTWIEFGRKEGDTDEEWAAACKEMAKFLQEQEDQRNSEEASARAERKL